MITDKHVLVEMVNQGEIDMDVPIQKEIVGNVVRKLVKIGIDRFRRSWNYHRIPGPCKAIPAFKKDENNPIEPVGMPSVQEAVEE